MSDGYSYLRDNKLHAYVVTIHGSIKPNLRKEIEEMDLVNCTISEKMFSFVGKPETMEEVEELVADMARPPATITSIMEIIV
jgi:rRNA processing protein Krr1/Pno1